MPTRFRSLLLALVLAASVSACLTASAGGDPDTPIRQPRLMLGPIQLHPKRHVRRRKRTLGERAARIALRAVGIPYRWGGSSPDGGFDCSGLVYWTYGKLGIELPHSSYALAGEGRRIGRSHLKPGDLLFFYGYGHVGLYLGRGRMVHAPHTGRRVEVVRLARSSYGRVLDTARRVR
jgi:cell wall-associated NlpC family hydrolase